MAAKTVCLDPGHGPTTVNGSPDGTYKEQEFAWDLYTRIRPLLLRRGVRVVVTRTQDDKPSLTARAQVSNNAGADLFLSLHTNAAGNSGWSAPRGFLALTSASGNAPRNAAAQAIIQEARAAGVVVRGSGLSHNATLTVLAKTKAPAVLIEYGFHTNREDVALLKTSAYRDKLAEATARGACAFLGIPWEDTKGEDEMTEQQVREIVETVLEEQRIKTYDTLQEVPEWGRETVSKLVNRGLLLGDGRGLGLTYDLLRQLVLNDRARLYQSIP